jgi:hypothetical protein
MASRRFGAVAPTNLLLESIRTVVPWHASNGNRCATHRSSSERVVRARERASSMAAATLRLPDAIAALVLDGQSNIGHSFHACHDRDCGVN